MAGFCLTPKLADELKTKFLSGEINPEKLAGMSSKERREFFVKHVGEANAEPVNRLFESKLILKNQQQGMVNWARQLIGVTPQAKRDIISKIQRMDKVLEPHDEKAFLEDLASHRLGTRVTYDEAQKIVELSNKIDETKAEMEKGGDRMVYGRAVGDLKEYVANLKRSADKLTLEEAKNQPGKAAVRVVENVAGTAKAVQASMDNSAVFRQGWKTMWTHPGIWAANGARSFRHLFKYFGQDTVMRELNADIMSRPNALNGYYEKGKVDVGVAEEAFPTTLPEKVPVFGRLYKASENAYSAFVRKTRADVFDKYIEIAEKNGVDLNVEELQSIGKMVNSLTGRGHLGKLEPVGKTLNNFFFSPKMLKSHIDVLTQPLTGAGGSDFVRKEAAKNLVKMAVGTAAAMAIAKTLCPKCVELDPRSADFGKVRVGNTRFDMTGGMSGLLVLMSRIAAASANYAGMDVKSYKSSTSGKLSDLTDPKFGQNNLLDVIESFFENKLSPVAGMVRDFAKGENFDGEKPTVPGEVLSLFTPLPIKTLTELLSDPEAKKDKRFVAFAQAMDMMGITVNTYKPKKKDGPKKPDLDLGKLLERLQKATSSGTNPEGR